MSMVLKIWLSLLLVAVGIYGSYSLARAVTHRGDHKPPSTAMPASPELYDFTFTGTDGKPYSLDELKGKVWVGSFFFAQCPGFCRQLNQSIAALSDELKDQDVTFVSFSVDPANDTPERLAEYATSLGARPDRWKFLVSDLKNTNALGQGVFKVAVMGQSHTNRLILVGPDGRIRGSYSFDDPNHMAAFRQELKRVQDEQAEDRS